jgi:hypothetical protein
MHKFNVVSFCQSFAQRVVSAKCAAETFFAVSLQFPQNRKDPKLCLERSRIEDCAQAPKKVFWRSATCLLEMHLHVHVYMCIYMLMSVFLPRRHWRPCSRGAHQNPQGRWIHQRCVTTIRMGIFVLVHVGICLHRCVCRRGVLVESGQRGDGRDYKRANCGIGCLC